MKIDILKCPGCNNELTRENYGYKCGNIVFVDWSYNLSRDAIIYLTHEEKHPHLLIINNFIYLYLSYNINNSIPIEGIEVIDDLFIEKIKKMILFA